jgi:hypothetical protein
LRRSVVIICGGDRDVHRVPVVIPPNDHHTAEQLAITTPDDHHSAGQVAITDDRPAPEHWRPENRDGS